MAEKVRLIIKVIDEAAPAHGADAPAKVSYQTVDVDAPAVVALLQPNNSYLFRSVVGAEVVKEANRG